MPSAYSVCYTFAYAISYILISKFFFFSFIQHFYVYIFILEFQVDISGAV